MERNIRRLAQAFIIAFLLLSLPLAYWQVIRAPELVIRPDNPRQVEAALRAQRGRIFDRNGEVLAFNQLGPEGFVTRVYTDAAFTPVTGYASPQYGLTGIERAADAVLRGAVPLAMWLAGCRFLCPA